VRPIDQFYKSKEEANSYPYLNKLDLSKNLKKASEKLKKEINCAYSIEKSIAQCFKVTLLKQFRTARAAFSLQNFFPQKQSFKYKIIRRSITSFL